MPTRKLIGGSTISDDDPMQVRESVGMTNSSSPTKITVTTSSTEIVLADPDRTWSVLVSVHSGGPVFVHEDDDATTDDFPIATGAIIEHASTRALNGIVASGSADVRTWPNGGA